MQDGFIKQIGPIASVPIPNPGVGIIVYEGFLGDGKSNALAAVEYLLTGNGDKPRLRDKQADGEISAFGRTIEVGDKVRSYGAVNIPTLDARYTLTEFVDPGIKDPVAADSRRAKVLLQTLRVQGDPKLFYDLLGSQEEFEQVVSKGNQNEPDLVKMGTGIKKDIEQRSRDLAEASTRAKERAEGILSAHGHKTPPARSLEDVSADWEFASQRADELAIRKSEIDKLLETMRSQRSAFASLADPQPKLTQQRELVREADGLLQIKRDTLLRAESALREAQQAFDRAQLEKQNAESQLDRHKQELSSLESQVSEFEKIKSDTLKDLPQPIDPSELEEAKKLAQDLWAEREACKAWKEIEQSIAEANQLLSQSEGDQFVSVALRNSAQEVDSVLTACISKATDKVFWKDDRLKVIHPVRGETFFSELSKGERWRIAFELACRSVGQGGAFVVPQEAWEGLPPSVWFEAAEMAIQYGVMAFTGRATDEHGLRATVIDAQAFSEWKASQQA